MATSIGIDLGGTKLLAVRQTDGVVEAEQLFSAPAAPHRLSAAVNEAARYLWTDEVGAVGVGVAGLVRWPQGVLVWGPHVTDTDVHLREALVDEFGIVAAVDNDANMSLYGEKELGAAREYNEVLLVTLGTGIGGAVMLDGKIQRGASFAGEWGHTLYEAGGLQCACGRRGCWETQASGPALLRLASQFIADNPDGAIAGVLDGEPLTPEAVTRAADAGDESARALVAQVGVHLGYGLCNLIAIFDPEIIIVGGGLGSVGEALLGPARRVAADAVHGGSYRRVPPVLVASLGPASGAVGAATMAHDLASGRLQLV
jgi:glucokinase